MKTPHLLALVFSLTTVACGPTSGGGGDGDGDGDGGPVATDDDGDGYSEDDGDCRDDDASIHPGVVENCSDGIDNNCDGHFDANDYACMSPCERADIDRSSVGCIYYGVDTNALGGPYAIAVSN